jgi:hypothetical protein
MAVVRALAIAAVFLTVVVACADGDTRSESARPSGSSASTSLSTSTSTTPPVDSPADVVPPRTPRDAATRITAIERALRDPATPPGELPALAWEQAVIYGRLAREPMWLTEVSASVPADIAPIVAANTGAASSLTRLVDPPVTLPSWRIVTPPPPEELLGYYREAEMASGIPWQYLAAINLVETRMGRIVGDSSAGAQGPMQFIPSSWEAFGAGGDVHDPRDAILAAGRYLAAAGGPSDMRAAIFAYNHSDAYVDAVTRYASMMQADERAYLGYYHWPVNYRTVDGLFLLPEGYPTNPAVEVS